MSYMMPTVDELRAYIRDHYGVCDRKEGCYWSKDKKGRLNGCLHPNNMWMATACPHWHPAPAEVVAKIIKSYG